MVKKIFYSASLYLVAVMFTACSSSAPMLQSNWQDKVVTIDAKASEWGIPLQYYDNDTKLNYAISNDDSNLYYCFRIGDDKEQMRVMRAGMQFWIDTTGKNLQQVGIQFPFPQLSAMTSPSGQGGGGHHGRTDTTGTHKWSGKPNEMRLTGFVYPISGVVPVPNTYGIKVSIARDSTGVVIYEAAIPFRTFYRPGLSAKDNNKILGITIILNAMQTSGHSEGGGHHGGGSSGTAGMGGMSRGMGGMGSGGGFGGGGMGGGRRGGGGSQDQGDPDDKTTSTATLKLRLKLTAR